MLEQNVFKGQHSSQLCLNAIAADGVLFVVQCRMRLSYSLQMDDEEVALVRQKLIAVRQAWFKRNEEEVIKRWAFEEAVCLSNVFVLTVRFVTFLVCVLSIRIQCAVTELPTFTKPMFALSCMCLMACQTVLCGQF